MLNLKCEDPNLDQYILETEEVDVYHPAVQYKAEQLFHDQMSEADIVRTAFEFVRDEISHSWDIRSERITRKASEVLTYKEGICYAKANLLAALLRLKNIPTGFCYQRITLGDTPDTGYCIHALNAVYLQSIDRWVRIDARGNKEGVDAQFSLDEEKLAFPVRTHYDEFDYLTIYKAPNPNTMYALKSNHCCTEMYKNKLPAEL